MNFKNKELIIFDLDGTLVDSAPDLALSLNLMLESIGHTTFDEDLIRSWVGNGAQTLVKRGLSGSTDINEDINEVLFQKALSTFLDIYAKNLCVKTVLYQNVANTLEVLKSKGHRMVIVTNKPFDFVAPMLDSLGINEIFELHLGGDSLSKRKPDPLPLLHVCENLSIDVKNTLMIGDSKNDILAAKAAGMHSVGVSYGYNYGECISIHKPEHVVDDFADILALLD